MPKHSLNSEVTSKRAASAAAKVLRNPNSSKAAKTAAASVLNSEAQTLDHYRSQVRAYLDITRAERGLIVPMTKGAVIAVSPSPQTVAA